jgi:hypothetical protein
MQIQVSPKLTIQNSEEVSYRLYLLNMGEKLKGKWKAIIPLTKMCHDFLKEISPKESHQQARRPGQQSGVYCVINTTKGRRQYFDAMTVRLDFALKDVSRHSIPSYTFKARFYYTFEEIRDSLKILLQVLTKSNNL